MLSMEIIHSDFDFSTHFHVQTTTLNVHDTKVNWKKTGGFQNVEQKKKSERGDELLRFASFTLMLRNKMYCMQPITFKS